MRSIIVSKDNDGDYCNIQEALDAIPYDEDGEIIVKEGVYNEKLFSDKRSLTIKGEGQVVITYGQGAREILSDGLKRGTFRTYTAFFSGRKLRLENITIENSAGSGKKVGQALALYLDAEESVLENVVLKGYQDTLFLSPLPESEREKRGFYGPRYLCDRKRTSLTYIGGRIEGSVDFIFGGGDALFKDTEIVSVEEGYVTAPSGKRDWEGMVFDSCRFTSTLCEKESVYLMRPWRDEGKSIFRNCTFGAHINRKGFSPWPGREEYSHLSTFKMENCSFI